MGEFGEGLEYKERCNENVILVLVFGYGKQDAKCVMWEWGIGEEGVGGGEGKVVRNIVGRWKVTDGGGLIWFGRAKRCVADKERVCG